MAKLYPSSRFRFLSPLNRIVAKRSDRWCDVNGKLAIGQHRGTMIRKKSQKSIHGDRLTNLQTFSRTFQNPVSRKPSNSAR